MVAPGSGKKAALGTSLGEVLLQPGVVGADEFFGGAVEDDFALVEDEEAGAGVDAVVIGAVDGDHVLGFRVEAVGGEGEGVLEAVGDEQAGGVGDVALLDDELDDGGGGDGVEAAGGGVVEDEIGAGDDGAGDGGAAPHAAGELGGELGLRVVEGGELEGLEGTFVGFFRGDVIGVEAIGDVVFDGEGVEEGGLLKDHPDAGAEGEEVALGHGLDFLAKDADGPGVWAEEAVDQLEEDTFAGAGGAEDDALLAGGDGEGDVFEDGFAVETDGNVVEDDDGAGVRT